MIIRQQTTNTGFFTNEFGTSFFCYEKLLKKSLEKESGGLWWSALMIIFFVQIFKLQHQISSTLAVICMQFDDKSFKQTNTNFVHVFEFLFGFL